MASAGSSGDASNIGEAGNSGTKQTPVGDQAEDTPVINQAGGNPLGNEPTPNEKGDGEPSTKRGREEDDEGPEKKQKLDDARTTALAQVRQAMASNVRASLTKEESKSMCKWLTKHKRQTLAECAAPDLFDAYRACGKDTVMQRAIDGLQDLRAVNRNDESGDESVEELCSEGRLSFPGRTAATATTWEDLTSGTSARSSLAELFDCTKSFKRMHHVTNNVSGFPDPTTGQRDWLIWVAANQHVLTTFSEEEANYVMLVRAGSEHSCPVRLQYGAILRSMSPREVTIALGRVIYRKQGRDPLRVASQEVFVGAPGCPDLRSMFSRIITLNYCRGDHPPDRKFVADLLGSLMIKMTERESSSFISRIHAVYPTVMPRLQGDGINTRLSADGVLLQAPRLLPPGTFDFPRGGDAMRAFTDFVLEECCGQGVEGTGLATRNAFMITYPPSPPTSPPQARQVLSHAVVPAPVVPPAAPQLSVLAVPATSVQQPTAIAEPPPAREPKQVQPKAKAKAKAQVQGGNSGGGGQRRIRCLRCYEYGHIARVCPNNPRPNLMRSSSSGPTNSSNDARPRGNYDARNSWEARGPQNHSDARDGWDARDSRNSGGYFRGPITCDDEGNRVGLWCVVYERFEDTACPGYPLLCDDIEIAVLFDTGSPISLFPAALAMSRHGLVKRKLQAPVLCGTINMTAEGEVRQEGEFLQVKPLVAEMICIVPLMLWGFQVWFPLHVVDMARPMLVLGCDFLNRIGFGILLDTTELVLKCPETYMRDMNAFYDYTSHRGSALGIAYADELQGPSLGDGITPVSCRMVRGVPLCNGEHLLVFERSYRFLARVPKKVALLARGLCFRRGQLYSIELCWWLGLFVSASQAGSSGWLLLHLCGDTDRVECTLASPFDYEGAAGSPVGLVSVGKRTQVSSVCFTPKVGDERVPSESVDQFKLVQVFKDLPIPKLGEALLPVRDYTQEEYQCALSRLPELLLRDGAQWYMTPKKGVRIPVEIASPAAERKYLLAAWTLASLPSGVWAQEHPDRLPGIPMQDVAIRVKLTTDVPVYRKARPMNEAERGIASRQLRAEVDLGLFEPANSPYSCNITWAPKPGGDLRLCVNYQPINEITVKDRYPLPRLENVVRNLSGKEFISLVDVKRGFNNLVIHPEDRPYLAFSSPMGQLQPVRMPFGWCNGPPAFQRVMDETMAELKQFYIAYIDDISGGSKVNQREHDLLLGTLLANLARRGFVLHADKAQILPQYLQLVGLRVDGKGALPSVSPGFFERLLAKKHKTLRDVQSTIGALNWFRGFVPAFSYVIRPLTQHLKSECRHGNQIEWTPECQEAISKVKEAVESAPLRVHPLAECEKRVYLVAGIEAYAVMLTQDSWEGGSGLIEFWSKRWSLRVESYRSYERVALAVRETVRHFYAELHASSRIRIYSSDRIFNVLAGDQTCWSERLQKYLACTLAMRVSFHQPEAGDEKCIEILRQHVCDEPLPGVKRGLETRVMMHFRLESEAEARKIPIVHTDGACVTSKSTQRRVGGLGVYWGVDSSLNLSQRAQREPVSNQSAELEAIALALKQASTLQIARLVLLSDSAYAVNSINEAQLNWTLTEDSQAETCEVETRRGERPKNADLFGLILWRCRPRGGLEVYFEHVKRAANAAADALASQALTCAPSAVVLGMMTRAQARRERNGLSVAPADSAAGEPTPGGDVEELECFIDLTDSEEEPEPVEEVREIPSLEFDSEPDSGGSEVESEEVGPSGSGPPLWTVDTGLRSRERLPSTAVLRLNAPHVGELLKLVAALPGRQAEDLVLGPIIEALRGGDAGMEDRQRRAYSKYSVCGVTGSLVVRMKQGCQRFVVPESLKVPVMELFHSSLVFGGHPGPRGTVTHIRRYFYWEGMDKVVESYCRNCAVCVATRNQQGRIAGLLTAPPIPCGPLVRVHLDTLHGLPSSQRGKYVLVAMCAFSKYIFAEVLHGLSPRCVIVALTSIFTRFGQPGLVVSDNGTEFRNKEVQAFLKMWGVGWKYSAPHNPQANGQAEAGVKIMSARLRAMINDFLGKCRGRRAKSSWPDIVPYAAMTYNYTPNVATGFAPYELVFGKMPPLPIAVPVVEGGNLKRQAQEYFTNVQLALEEAHQLASSKLMERRDAMADQFNRFRSALNVVVGDWVFITHPYSAVLPKLGPRAYGPYEVTRVQRDKEGNVMYVECLCVVEGRSAKEVRVFPRRRIRPVAATLPEIDWDELRVKEELEDAPGMDEDFPEFADTALDALRRSGLVAE